MNQTQPQKQNIELKNARGMTCPKCGGDLFTIVHKIMQVSKLDASNPTGHDVVIPRPYFKCLKRKCGHILKNVVPA